VNLETPLVQLDFVPQVRARQLARFGLATAGDLLVHFPRRYEDRRQFDAFPTDTMETAVCVCGTVARTKLRRFRGTQRMFDVIIEDGTGSAIGGWLMLRWFNSPWVEKMFVQGHRVVVYGKPKRSGTNLIIAHPDFEIVENDADESIHLKRIAPIHGATEGISPRLIRTMIWKVLERLADETVPNLLPAKLDPTPRAWALRQMHFPENDEALAKARRHFVLEEFFRMQLAVAASRTEHQQEPGAAHCGSGELMAKLHASLPFPLTGAQKRAVAEIQRDLAAPHPMNRLLHGDVGAGKTLVAMSAMLLCVEAGFQAALMAPTQILAEQHYLNFKRLLDPLGIRVALRTGSRREGHDTQTGSLFGGSDAPQIFIGTHALLYEGAGFTNLGLAVIDEQHKFGVMQRAKLREQAGEVAPDVLVMTATPIPRTLTMTLYGDLDVSILDELPPGRGKIVTGIRPPSKLPDAAKFIRTELESGRQCYIVYPLVEESEKLEAKSATVEFEKWRALLAPMPCELIHGRIAPEEKEAIMERFRSGHAKALIATTVIEVGVDVPNATIMLIENAERFGLAQLHQLRGRIGRGGHKSYCVLITSAEDPESIAKLQVLVETTDGFRVAEEDLKQRGWGNLLGTEQAGKSGFRLGDPIAQLDLMQLARNHAFLIFEHDPMLLRPEHAGAKILLLAARKATFAQVS
jgi:ATP-dependent DNA helicase RecG